MKKYIYFLLIMFSCYKSQSQSTLINPSGSTISTRFLTPKGFVRLNTIENSFGSYLQNLELQKHGSLVHLYDGTIKTNQIQEAVIKIDVGKKNLQQCADAIMRLRAEYLYKQKLYSKIGFHFTNGWFASYSEWRKGKTIKIEGNKCSWIETKEEHTSYESFRKYLDLIFAYAGTISLSKELKAKSIEKISIGDVFIQSGSPGHAIIVVDLAKNNKGEKIFMLAQSYMPAQEIHILKNPENQSISPWFKSNTNQLKTPEWDFNFSDLKGFE